jgi:hypothetical protein
MPSIDDEIELVLRIDMAAEPIRGSLTTSDGACRTFSGWIGLSAALERIHAAAMPPHDAPGAT